MKTASLVLAGFICYFIYSNPTTAAVQTYPAPAGEPLSPNFTVSVDGKNSPVYLATVVSLSPEERVKVRDMIDPAGVTSKTSFTSFDLRGSAEITVSCPQAIQSAKILPASSGLVPKISGNKLSFSVSKAAQLTLEVNDDWVNSLHLFVNPPETNLPKADDPKVIYFGPGIHEINQVKVTSGQTVYIAGGAVLYASPLETGKSTGPMFWLSGTNITLRGRGIIDGSKRPHPGGGHPIVAEGTNIKVEGVILRDSPTWNFPIRKSANVDIRNLKIIGWRSNSDGIDICNSCNVTVSDCFLRTFDDLVVIKSYDPQGGPAKDITVKNCILWNEFAHALSLGAELRMPVENVTFSDCEVIHDKGREWLLRVYHCDSAPVKDIRFDNIRSEETQRLMSLWIGKAIWTKDAERGHIDNVTFSNILSPLPSRTSPYADLVGFDAEHAIHGVRFEHALVGGNLLQASDIKQNEFVQDVQVNP